MPDLTGDAEGSRAAKIALRSRLLTARRQAPASAAPLLHDQVLALVRREQPATIAAYVPIGTEPGGPELITALAAHARVLLPVLLPDGDLDWALHSGSLERGPRGLLAPTGPRLGVEGIRQADLVLVPALAVDRQGLRLGRGGGSYDRALARISPGPLIVALLHDGELLDEVPAEPHDRPVHGVITPHGGLFLTRK
ncbi:5-formyltetrahydrofolate cyclo-ligase [Actinoplanes sp. NPDC048988]|uniref:5-formyltetrahydrofolate cyclo-ligase n=1 Tax=Actinoplanes sp. NPDC048988 TaxID=3363901 RepID=UPI0037220CC9